MNFGKWIVVAFVLFAGFIGTLVTVCMRQDIPLVSKDYYKEELAYQEQITRVENTSALLEKPAINVKDGHVIRVQYGSLSRIEKGTLKLVRPSDAGLDEQFQLTQGSGPSQEFVMSHPEPGLYRAKFTWEQDGKQYYMEKLIVL